MTQGLQTETNGNDLLSIIFFAVSVALAILSMGVSVFAFYMAQQEANRAQGLWDKLVRDVTGMVKSSERTEKTTDRLFEAMIRSSMVPAGGIALDEDTLSKRISEAVETATRSSGSYLPAEAVSEVTGRLGNELRETLRPFLENAQRSKTLLDATSGASNPAIAERYVKLARDNPGRISVTAIREADYPEYVQILDYLMANGVLEAPDGFLRVSPDYVERSDGPRDEYT